MSADPILLSIRHTGTHFMLKSVLIPSGVNVQAHGHGDFDRLLSEYERAVIPLRDPVRCAISSLNRGEAVEIALFNVIAGYADNPDVHFFRVDGPEDERDAEVDGLARFLGRPIRVESWEPKNSTPDHFGLHAAYTETGDFPEAFTSQVGDSARTFLRSVGYGMKWMEA